jgi:hypothetical protein
LQHGHATALSQQSRLNLVAEQFEYLGPWSHKSEPRIGATPGEPGVLAQKAISGMNGAASGLPGDGDDLLDIEIRRCADAAQWTSVVGFSRMQRMGVVFRKNGHGADTQLGGRTHDTNGDLAAIGD